MLWQLLSVHLFLENWEHWPIVTSEVPVICLGFFAQGTLLSKSPFYSCSVQQIIVVTADLQYNVEKGKLLEMQSVYSWIYVGVDILLFPVQAKFCFVFF